MSQDICLDANIFVASLANEPARDACQTLIKNLEDENACFFEPALIVFEVTSAIQKKIAFNNLTASEAKTALNLFFELPLLLQWQAHILTKASDFARHLGFKDAYDASYLSVAESRNIPLITLDDSFYRKAKGVYKQVYTVEEFLKKRALLT